MKKYRSFVCTALCVSLILLPARLVVAAHTRLQVVQQTTVEFPRSGRLRVQVVASKKGGRVVFRSDATGRLVHPLTRGGRVASRSVLTADAGDALFFKVIGVAGPMILVSTVHRGADYCGYTARLFGEAAGRLRLLTPGPLETDDMGGLYVGDLGAGRGRGVAVWRFIWGEGEAHFDAHRYEFKLFEYRPRSGSFAAATVLKSKSRHERWEEVAGELGLPFQNSLTGCEELFGAGDEQIDDHAKRNL